MTQYPMSLQVAPMKYANTPSQDKVDAAMVSTDWYMQEKFDGAWYMLEKIDNEHIYLFGRTTSKVTGELTEKSANVPHIVDWAKQIPDGTTLIGEIYIPGGHSNTVTTVMGCLPEKAIMRQEQQGYVQYKVFDCIRYAGEDLCDKPFSYRYGEILMNQLYNDWNDDIQCVVAYTLDDDSLGMKCETWGKDHWEPHDTFQIKLNEIFARGGEGAVFKKKDCPYRPGKRTTASQMFKMKEHIDSIDLVVMDVLDPVKEYTGKELDTWPYWGYISGEHTPYSDIIPIEIQKKKPSDYEISRNWLVPVTKPYYYGWKNALKIGAYDESGVLNEIGTVASGLTDEIRADLAANPNNYIGSVCELSCMSVNKKDHTIRHPVFMRFRDDKDPHDCLISEIFM